MVYNYYTRVNGGSEADFVRHRTNPADLVYPDGQVAGETSAGRALVNEPLVKIKRGWGRNALLTSSARQRLRGGTPSDEVAREAFARVVESIDLNNPVVSYTGLSSRTRGPIHIVVLSGYAYDEEGRLWVHANDPATMVGKVALIGATNLHVIESGDWNANPPRGAKYWLRAGRLLELNENSREPNDLWGDYAGGAGPGIASWITMDPTPETEWTQVLGSGGGLAPASVAASLPLDLGDGPALTAEAVENAYAHVERGGRGGWYPVGANTLWHGGVHLRPAPDDPDAPRAVRACLPGRVVAARLGAGAEGEGPFGSRNFVVVRHEMPAPPSDGGTEGATPPEPGGAEPGVFYSLYMHLAALADDRSGPARASADLEVTASTLNLRTSPETQGDQNKAAGGPAPRGTRVTPLATPPAPEANGFRWVRAHLPGGAVDAFAHGDHLAPPGGAVTAESVSWLRAPAPEEMVTTGPRNVRSSPRVDPSSLLLSEPVPAGTRFVPRPDAPMAALQAGRFLWGTVHLPAGRTTRTGATTLDGFVHDGALRKAETTGELDRALLDRLAGGAVVALDRPVEAGDVLWTVGTHGLRALPDDPLPEVLHWEMFSETNLLADLCRPPAPSGDGQAGAAPPAPPRPRAPSGRTVLVRRVEGPSEVEAGRPATYRVADYNVAPLPDDRDRVNWEVRSGGGVVATFRGAGERLVYTPPLALAGETVEVRPFMRSSTSDVAIRTRVSAPPPWWTAEDPGADFQTDADEVLDLFEGLDTTILGRDLLAERVVVAVEARRDGATPPRPALERAGGAVEPAGHLEHDELMQFYAADVGGRATRLRHAVCRFVSEWGMPDVRAAVDALGVSAPEATAAAVERHQWWAEARAAGCDLPEELRLWHYHPVSFLVHVAGTATEAESAASQDQTVVWGQRVSPEFKARVLQMAESLEINADYLMAIMAFESAETFSPSIWNQAGSRAVGLIQFMDGAASEPDLNTTLESLEAMTAVEQLDYVERYFRMRQRQFGKITTLSDVYMAVLRPANIGDPESAVLFRAGTTAYRQNAGLDSNGDGAITKAECTAKVQEKLERGEPLRG